MRDENGRFVKGNINWNAGKKLPYIPHYKKRGQTSWNKGLHYSQSLLKTNINLYKNIHKKINKIFGSPKKCEDCGTETNIKYEWANLSGKYLLSRNDWRRVCCKCHAKIGNINQKLVAIYTQ